MAPRLLEWVDALVEGREAPGTGGDNPRTRQAAWTATRLGRPVAGIRPARHVRVAGVLLHRTKHRQLLDDVLGSESGFVASSVIVTDTPRVDPDYRSSRTNIAVGPAADLLERRLRRLLPHVRRELAIPWFPIGRVECQLAAHQAGDFFKVHTDNGREVVAGRRLTCVYYFRAEPRGFSGGELRLHETADAAGRTESTGCTTWTSSRQTTPRSSSRAISSTRFGRSGPRARPSATAGSR